MEREFSKGVKGLKGIEYEPFKIPYVVHKDYIPDFVHEASGIIVECKGFFRPFDTQKYKAIRDSINRYNELVFILSDPSKKVRKGSKLNMGEWCTKEGFKFFTLDTVEEFINYVTNASRNRRKTSAKI